MSFEFKFINEAGKTVFLNSHLADEQELTIPDMQAIVALHEERVLTIKQLTNAESDQWIRLAAKIQDLEYQLQEAWGFEKDRTKHRHWFRIPHCRCPKMDNQEAIGFRRIYSMECPIHGNEEWLVIDKLS